MRRRHVTTCRDGDLALAADILADTDSDRRELHARSAAKPIWRWDALVGGRREDHGVEEMLGGDRGLLADEKVRLQVLQLFAAKVKNIVARKERRVQLFKQVRSAHD
eukprot:2837692-Pleurochrysis_carterae.AAC.1